MDILNPIEIPEWERMLLQNSGSSFFHTSVWARVLHESYGYKPVYFASINNNKIDSLLPLMEVNSFLTGKRAVSLPFTDYCHPFLTGPADLSEMIQEVIQLGSRSGWKYIELRGGGPSTDMHPSAFHLGHALNLTSGEEAIYSGLRDSTRRNIRKAEKEGVEVRISNSSESLAEFYRLNCITRKAHGLPPQPYRFFRKIYEHVLCKGYGMISLARFKEKSIAGSINLHFRDKAIYKYGASDSGYNHLRANNLVTWETIRWYVHNGFGEFSFGRTEPGNSGLLQFKRGWGASEHTINYHKYDLRKHSYVKDKSRLHGFHNKVFSNMPMPVLRMTGSILYKHIG